MIQLISAYILKQRGYVDDPDKAHNKTKPKSWFKQIMADYPTSFEDHMTLTGMASSGLVTSYGNYNENEGGFTSKWDKYLTEIAELPISYNLWILKTTASYVSPGDTYSFNLLQYIPYNGTAVVGVNGHLRIVDINGAVSGQTVSITAYAQTGASAYTESQVPGVYGYNAAYPISLDIRVPIFSRSDYGQGYAQAAYNYHENPTPANYEAVCAYIDLCLNPDG